MNERAITGVVVDAGHGASRINPKNKRMTINASNTEFKVLCKKISFLLTF